MEFRPSLGPFPQKLPPPIDMTFCCGYTNALLWNEEDEEQEEDEAPQLGH